jgi:hypothetical protein
MGIFQIAVSSSVIFFSVAQSLVSPANTVVNTQVASFDQTVLYIPNTPQTSDLPILETTSGKKIINTSLQIQHKSRLERIQKQKLLIQRKSKSTAKSYKVYSKSSNHFVSNNTNAYENAIRKRCAFTGCDPTQIIRVMYCESGGRANANENPPYIGLFQFLPSTFYKHAGLINIKNPNIWNPYHQISVTVHLFSIGGSEHWGCK